MKDKPRKVIVRGEVRWYVEHLEAGKRRREFFRTKEAAEARQAVLRAIPETEPVIPIGDPNVLVRDFADIVLAHHKAGWRPRSYDSMQSTIKLHVLPFRIGPGDRTLGDLRMREWSRGIVPALVATKRNAGYSADACRLIYLAANLLLTAAVSSAHRLLAVHPIDAATRRDMRPNLRRRDDETEEIRAFDAAQARRFLEAAKATSRLYPLYATGFLAGLRLGELCGLQLDHDRLVVIERERRRQLAVEQQLGQECSMRNPRPGPPKGGKARDVNVGADLGAIFDDIKGERPALAMRKAWRPVPPWMFVTSNGTPYSQRNVLRDFDRVLTRAKLADKGFTPHSMRHSFASLHILAGKSATWLQQQMGHKSVKVTLDVYARWFKLQDHAAADALGSSLLGNTAGNRL